MRPTYQGTHSCGAGQLAWIAEGDVTENRVRECLIAPGLHWSTGYTASVLPVFTGVAQITFIDVRYDRASYREMYPSKNGKTGLALAKYIKEHGLGTCTSGRWTENPVHPGRKIKTYVWSLDMKGYKAWLAKQPEYKALVTAGRKW